MTLPGYDEWKTRAPEDDELPLICSECGTRLDSDGYCQRCAEIDRKYSER